MKQVTLIFLTKDNSIALAQKKRGFGKGYWNGYGGKLEEGETIEQAAVRELMEEAGVKVNPSDLNKVGEILFRFKHKPECDQNVHWFFVSKYSGEPLETEEMGKATWFERSELPYSEMWPADAKLMAKMVVGNLVKAEVLFNETGYDYVKFL